MTCVACGPTGACVLPARYSSGSRSVMTAASSFSSSASSSSSLGSRGDIRVAHVGDEVPADKWLELLVDMPRV